MLQFSQVSFSRHFNKKEIGEKEENKTQNNKISTMAKFNSNLFSYIKILTILCTKAFELKEKGKEREEKDLKKCRILKF